MLNLKERTHLEMGYVLFMYSKTEEKAWQVPSAFAVNQYLL